MKKYQYAVVIVLAVLFGAFITLWVGNTLTGVLSGVLMALAVSGLGSLKWEIGLVQSVACKAQAIAQFDYALFFGRTRNMSRQFLHAVGKGMSWFFRVGLYWFFKGLYCLTIGAGIFMARDFVKKPDMRKCWYYTVFSALVATGTGVLWGFYFDLLCLAPGAVIFANVIGVCFFFYFVVLSVGTVVLGLCVLFFLVYGYVAGAKWAFVKKGIEPVSDSPSKNAVADFLFSWWELGEKDNRPPFKSVLYMLKVRTLNALKFYAWVFLMLFYLPMKLFTFKTGAAMITAAVLSAIHLGVSYTFGWIAAGNVNFWLLCAVCMAVGAVAGMKIHALKKFEVKLPTITWLEHLKLENDVVPAENGV